MTNYFKRQILKATGATSLEKTEVIQELWSGYGEIIRYRLFNSKMHSVVVKYIKTDISMNHPRGWNSDISHNRKLKSYQIEMTWYKNWADMCTSSCHVPKCLGIYNRDGESLIILEDLNESGYNKRVINLSIDGLKVCLTWLANFHSVFINKKPEGLWENGTYWHIETRPDELKILDDVDLKRCAQRIEDKLNNTSYKTLVHGDAKLANFCFSDDEKSVAMVDFQYVGGGCGIKDVVYFIGSCLYEEDCEKYEEELLDHYFRELRYLLKGSDRKINIDDLELQWRKLYPYAWADFHRFLKGWSPGHWKLNSYSERLSREVINEIERG